MSSLVALSATRADVRWKEVVFTAKAAQDALEAGPSDPSASVQPGAPSPINILTPEASAAPSPSPAETPSSTPTPSTSRPNTPGAPIPRLTRADERFPRTPEALPEEYSSNLRKPAHLPPGFCEECFVPVAEDPDPETLFIFLHALRYSTPKLGAWSTPLPRWAGSQWEGDWRGWSEETVPEPFMWEGDELKGEVGEVLVKDGTPGESAKEE